MRKLDPTAAREREPVLDVLRGFALLGILLVNVELMRGSAAYGIFLGLGSDAPVTTPDQVASFLTGWLVSVKFVSAFSLMFGVGAALMAGRALDAGGSPRALLARRYGWLMVFGVAHMLLLFPGDVLFVYGVTGMVLLLFVQLPVRTLRRWSAGLLLATTVLVSAVSALVQVVPQPSTDPMATVLAGQLERAAAAFTDGSYLEVIGANATLSLLAQSGQLSQLPWFLALFLFGFSVGRSGLVRELRERTPILRRTAVVGLGIGLPVNLVLGLVGPLGGAPASMEPWVAFSYPVVQLIGAPLVALGYLATLALICLRRGPIRPLAAVGRMALSAYLLQSVLALAVFWGFGFYDRLGAAQALIVVLGIWIAVLVFSVAWMRSFRFGPAEWVWRTLTYGRGQPLRLAAADRP